MKINKKVTMLSKANLDKVYQWAEENESDPLAQAYMGTLYAIGVTYQDKMIDRLKKVWGTKSGKYVSAAFANYDFLFASRDSLGRVILDMLKKEQKEAAK